MSYQPKVYRQQGGDVLVVASGGEINVNSGGTITAAGTQASAITDPTDLAETITAVEAVIDALEGVGILAAAS